jgi:predicted nucleotidyltransferase
MVSSATSDLPQRVQDVLDKVVEAAKAVLGDTLDAIVLYGSAAEGRLRPTSDVNLIFVLKTFDRERLDRLRDSIRMASAAIRLTPMIILRDEIPIAAESFAVKFDDILRRRKILAGADVFSGVTIPRDRLVTRLNQVLLNLRLRLRSFYMTRSMFEEQLAAVIADAAGPLRSAAATLLELEGQQVAHPKDALLRVVESLHDPRMTEAVQRISEARERGTLPSGAASDTMVALIDLAGRMQSRARALVER